MVKLLSGSARLHFSRPLFTTDSAHDRLGESLSDVPDLDGARTTGAEGTPPSRKEGFHQVRYPASDISGITKSVNEYAETEILELR